MAEVKTKREPAFLQRLASGLIGALKTGGIPAKVDYQPVRTTRLYRVAVLAPKFKQLKSYERQNLVWRIAEKTLTPDEQLRISMILTLTPEEAGDN
jgi:hypothetical protein